MSPHESGGRPSVSCDNQFKHLPMLVEITLPMLIGLRQLQTDTAITARLVPQLVEMPGQDLVVRCTVERAMEFTVGNERFLASLAGNRTEAVNGRFKRGNVVVGAVSGSHLDRWRIQE